VALDLYLYVAFAAGFAIGHIRRVESIWIGRATLVAVLVLIGLLGDLLGSSRAGIPLWLLPLALLFSLTLVLVSVGIAGVLVPRQSPPSAGASKAPPLTTILFPAVLLIGVGLGRSVSLPSYPVISWTLYALIFLVAYDLRIVVGSLRRAPIPVVAAVTSAILVAVAFSWIPGLPLRLTLGTALGFGWYTLAGPLAAAQLGAAAGIFAFLGNFLRELLTMLLAPVLGPKVRAEGIAAMGGATAMDTTLWFVKEYGDRDAGSLALGSGLILTVAASLLVPLALALP
jgi:uncharacterized membrane protein YbjE (DUF340 family)